MKVDYVTPIQYSSKTNFIIIKEKLFMGYKMTLVTSLHYESDLPTYSVFDPFND